jgi:hypothetical protein
MRLIRITKFYQKPKSTNTVVPTHILLIFIALKTKNSYEKNPNFITGFSLSNAMGATNHFF